MADVPEKKSTGVHRCVIQPTRNVLEFRLGRFEIQTASSNLVGWKCNDDVGFKKCAGQ